MSEVYGIVIGVVVAKCCICICIGIACQSMKKQSAPPPPTRVEVMQHPQNPGQIAIPVGGVQYPLQYPQQYVPENQLHKPTEHTQPISVVHSSAAV
jgi:hypothetical protein